MFHQSQQSSDVSFQYPYFRLSSQHQFMGFVRLCQFFGHSGQLFRCMGKLVVTLVHANQRIVHFQSQRTVFCS